MQTEVSVEVLTQIVKSVFETMMNLDVAPSEASWVPLGSRLTSFVQLTGDWNGAVVMECSRQQACQFAGRILSMNPPESVDDDVRDVLGELANMIGGNLKSNFTPMVRLSMPSVMDGSDYDLRICGSEVRERSAYQCADGIFWVTVLATKE